jgi:hypothetical protein
MIRFPRLLQRAFHARRRLARIDGRSAIAQFRSHYTA